MSYEEPAYTPLGESGGVEYRRYEPHLIAETVVPSSVDFGSAGNEGFRRLFRYITGANTRQAKITMTAPVSQTLPGEKIAMTAPVQQAGTADGWRVAFMLPGQYTLATAPVPTDSLVKLVAVPGRLVAVLRYPGRWSEGNYRSNLSRLMQALAAARVRPVGEPWLARYNSPFSLPFLRRNEILVEVGGVPAGVSGSQ